MVGFPLVTTVRSVLLVVPGRVENGRRRLVEMRGGQRALPDPAILVDSRLTGGLASVCLGNRLGQVSGHLRPGAVEMP